MITIILFASVRERLGVGRLEVELPNQMSVAALVQRVVEDKGDLWGDVLQQNNVLVAVNQEMVTKDFIVKEGDEVAFFPPVTGG